MSGPRSGPEFAALGLTLCPHSNDWRGAEDRQRAAARRMVPPHENPNLWD